MARGTEGEDSAAETETPSTAEMPKPGRIAATPRPARPEPAHALERGNVVDRYIVLSLLGAGGMGEVYAAYDPELDRRIALKVIRSGSDGREGRLLAEAKALARLSHPNVVAVYDVGVVDHTVYIAMELVDGITVSAWLEKEPRE